MKILERLRGLFNSGILCCLLFCSCAKEINQYYNPKGSLDKNIIEVLEADGRFSRFVAMIDKLDLRKTLGAGAIYTCLAPTDEQVDAYLAKSGYASIELAPEAELRRYVNYHFINGMYYEYDINKIYNAATSLVAKTRATNFTTRTEGTNPGKSIRLFSSSFFTAQSNDFVSLYGVTDSNNSLNVEGISISEPDIDAGNGVIHVLGSELEVAPRTDEALAADPETTVFSSWLEKHVQYELGEKDEFGWVDTTLYKNFSIGRNLANESVLSTLLVPTNAAITEYFTPYLQYLDNTIDSVPKRVMYSLIRACIIENLWFKSDLQRYDPDWRALTGYPNMITNVPSLISGSVRASNSIVYKINKVVPSPEMHSVAGGVYLRYKKYSQWYWMFENAGISSGMYDVLYYQHSPKTVLIQSDDVWGFPLAEDMETDALELRKQECLAGVFDVDVRADNGFRKRFYPTGYGYVLYDNGRFYDYTGSSVGLVSTASEWDGANGAIYQVDGFLHPLDKLNDTLTVYHQILKDPELSSFASALSLSGVSSQLMLNGFFTFTILAPTNEAISNAGINISTMSTDELKTFVQSYIVPNRYVFSDGEFNGPIANKNGENVTFAGTWDTFSITNAAGKTIQPVASNVQGSNGVVHKVSNVF
ncbi:MAG: fasciclin domain-containing protein [Niabella sp.]